MKPRRPESRTSQTNQMAARVLLHLSGLDGMAGGSKSAAELRLALCGGMSGTRVADLADALRALRSEGKVVRVGVGADGLAVFGLAPRTPRVDLRRRTRRRTGR